MKRLALAAVLTAAILAFAAPMRAVAVTNSTTVRHLVYSFTWGVTNDTQVHTSGMADPTDNDPGAVSGMVDYSAGASDKGTITVDVVREQPDSGLVVSISEQAQNRRSAPAATCVVYGDTTVICDPNKKVNDEELTLLRFLGPHFVDPNALDAKQHWHVERDGTISTVADYTIANNAGGTLTINEVRQVKETDAHPQTSDITTTIGYDFTRAVPDSVTEYTIQRSERGEQYVTVKGETVLHLQNDSMALTKN